MNQATSNLHYFKFDILIHYQINIDDAALEELEFKKAATDFEVLLKQILFKNHPPKNINDISFVDSLTKLGFLKKTIDNKHFAQINDIFREKDNQNIEEPYCGAVYRDVLIFYNKNKITGIAKLCFSCGHFYIIGTQKDTSNFAQPGLLKKLQLLLNN